MKASSAHACEAAAEKAQIAGRNWPGTFHTVTRIRLSAYRWRKLIGVLLYCIWAMLFVRAIFSGQTSRAALFALPCLLFAAAFRPQLAILAVVPAATFGTALLPGLLSFSGNVLVAAVAALGLLTGRWRTVPLFQGTVVLLTLTVFTSAYSSGELAGTLSVRSLALYTGMGLTVMASAVLIRPRVDHVLLAIAISGAAVGCVVLMGWFRIDELTNEGDLLRVFALGLNPNYIGVILAVSSLAAAGLALERRMWWCFGLLAPCLMALPILKSRTSLLLLVVGTAALIVAMPGRRLRRLAITAGLLSILFLLHSAVVEDIYRSVLGARADLDLSESDQFRRDLAVFALKQGFANPLAGIGYGQFPVAAHRSFQVGYPAVHNEYLRVFAELGGLGLCLLTAIIIQVGRAAQRVPMRATVSVLLATYGIAMLFMETLQSLPTSMGVLVLAGTVVGWSHNSRASQGKLAISTPSPKFMRAASPSGRKRPGRRPSLEELREEHRP
jgi:hypothetical protein